MSMSPKKIAQICHKLAVVSQLMIESMDEARPILLNEEGVDEFNAASKLVQDKCEMLVKRVYEIDNIYNSTYFSDLTNKVDATIRKNFQPIK